MVSAKPIIITIPADVGRTIQKNHRRFILSLLLLLGLVIAAVVIPLTGRVSMSALPLFICIAIGSMGVLAAALWAIGPTSYVGWTRATAEWMPENDAASEFLSHQVIPGHDLRQIIASIDRVRKKSRGRRLSLNSPPMIIAYAALIALSIYGVFSVTSALFHSASFLGSLMFSAIIGWAVLLVVVVTAISVRRSVQFDANTVRQRDERAPILWLRSFKEDIGQLWSPLEDILVSELWHTGPVLAIGYPKDIRAPLGAARGYFSDAEWQQVATRWMDEASSIVLVAGNSTGLLWEIDQIARGRLGKTIFVSSLDSTNSADAWKMIGGATLHSAWAEFARGVDANDILMMCFMKNGQPVAICSTDTSGFTYQLGIRIAQYLQNNQAISPSIISR